MKRFLSLAAVFAFGLALCPSAAAQYLVVAACPNVAAIYATGQSNRVAAIDIYGTVCTSGSGGGGGAVTQGTVPWVVSNAGTFPVQAAQTGTWTVTGAGGTFPVTGTFWQATQPVSAASLPLPSGAATQTTLASILTNLGSPFQAGGSIGNTSFGISGTLPAFAATPTFNIGTAPTIAVTGTFFQATQPVSAVSLPLPSGAATAALQSTINTTLGSPMQQTGGTVTANLGTLNGVATAANQSTMATNQTAVQAPVAPGAATATKAELVGGQYNSAVQAFTNGQQGALQFDQRGGLLVQDGQAIPSVSVTSATTLFTVADTSGYGSISVQVTSAGSATITYEVSEDGTTWFSVAGYTPLNTGSGAPVTTSTTAIQLLFPTPAKQFRARVSTYTSGTVTVQGSLRKDTPPKIGVGIYSNVSASITASVNDGAAVGATGLPTLYEARTTNKTAVTTGQYVRPIATSIGAAINKPFQVPELDWSYPAAAGGISNTTTAVTMVGAAGAGIRNYLTAIQLSAPTLGAATEVAVRDGAGGTVIWRGFMSTAGGNQSVNLSSPVKSTANTLLEVVTLSATVTGAVYINAQGYQAP